MRGTSHCPALLAAAHLAVGILTTQATAQVTALSSESFAGAVMTYDAARHRLVVATALPSLWEWDGAHWGRMSVAMPAQATQALYDPVRARVLFVAAGTLFSYDGHDCASLGPIPFHGPIAVDTTRGVLFGAEDSGATNALTYEWNGTVWQPRAPVPAQRAVLALAYDPVRQVAVAELLSLAPFGEETWEWNGSAWSLRSAHHQDRGALAFDPNLGQVIATYGNTWSWNGTAWTALVPAVQAPAATSLAFDPDRSVVWSMNNSGAVVNTEVLWQWNGSTWGNPAAWPHPNPVQPLFTFDGSRGRAMLFGFRNAPARNSHDEWDGNSWQNVPIASGPPTRRQHAQVFDAARAETVLFGGSAGGAALGDTWTWNGVLWRLAATAGPSPRSKAAMAFDSTRGHIDLFGGEGPAGVLADHWQWDGAQWRLIASTTPMGPVLGAMGYDPLLDRLVLIDETYHTWQHDGTAWSLAFNGAPRMIDSTQPLVWNAMRQRLQGNFLDTQFQSYRFEWDGVVWRGLFPNEGLLTIDPVRGTELVFHAGGLATRSVLPASATSFGSPCGGASTRTSLTAFALPRPGDPAFGLDVRAAAAGRPALVGLGLGSGNTPLGAGCSLWLQIPLGAIAGATDANGVWQMPMPLPNDLAFRGLSFAAQAAVLDPASPGSMAVSQGLVLVVGD